MKRDRIITQQLIADLTANNCAKLDAIVNAMHERAQSGDIAANRFVKRFSRLAERMHKNAERQTMLAETMARMISKAENS